MYQPLNRITVWTVAQKDTLFSLAPAVSTITTSLRVVLQGSLTASAGCLMMFPLGVSPTAALILLFLHSHFKNKNSTKQNRLFSCLDNKSFSFFLHVVGGVLVGYQIEVWAVLVIATVAPCVEKLFIPFLSGKRSILRKFLLKIIVFVNSCVMSSLGSASFSSRNRGAFAHFKPSQIT